MKCIIILLFSTFCMHSQSLSEVQKNYTYAVKNKQICKQMITYLEKENNSSLTLGYLGAYQAVWANHAINPFQKLNTFSKGKKNIEEAIKKDFKNVELRYLRYSIQKNAPGFLNYKNNIEEDLKYLKENLSKIKDSLLILNLSELLK